MHIIPVASGKGGVGKSLVSANLSLALAQSGKKTVLVDLDLGGSNLHIIMGHNGREHGLGTFLFDKKVKFEEIIFETDYKNLLFIPGETEIPGMANLRVARKRKLIKNLLSLDADYLILDLGAGTSINTLDFFMLSGSGLLVTAPTLTATLNAYLFLKNILFRIMEVSFPKKSSADIYLSELKRNGASLQKIYMEKLYKKLEEIDPENFSVFQKTLASFNPLLVMNMLEDPKDTQKVTRLVYSAKQYLGIEMETLGVLFRDDLQNNALNSRLPILSYKPDTVLSRGLYRLADKVIELELRDDQLIIPGILEESFTIANQEAEMDFSNKVNSLEELLHCGALSTGDLIETIKNQQYDIKRLKRENNFLKKKLVKNSGKNV